MSMPDNDRIADPIDRAAAETEATLAHALTFRKPTGPLANGACHTCGAVLDPPLRWCDRDCCADWEREQQPSWERN